jgi:transposase
MLRLLDMQKKLQKERMSIDGSLIQSYSFKDTTGYSGKHHRVGTKISTLAEGTGIPLSVCFARGNRHDLVLAPQTLRSLEFAPSRLPITSLLADKGYDSRKFRRFALTQKFVPYIPRREGTKVRRKYQLLYMNDKILQKKRYVVEQTNSWLKSFRRLRHRFDYTLTSFESFVYLAILVICVRRLME